MHPFFLISKYIKTSLLSQFPLFFQRSASLEHQELINLANKIYLLFSQGPQLSCPHNFLHHTFYHYVKSDPTKVKISFKHLIEISGSSWWFMKRENELYLHGHKPHKLSLHNVFIQQVFEWELCTYWQWKTSILVTSHTIHPSFNWHKWQPHFTWKSLTKWKLITCTDRCLICKSDDSVFSN